MCFYLGSKQTFPWIGLTMDKPFTIISRPWEQKWRYINSINEKDPLFIPLVPLFLTSVLVIVHTSSFLNTLSRDTLFKPSHCQGGCDFYLSLISNLLKLIAGNHGPWETWNVKWDTKCFLILSRVIFMSFFMFSEFFTRFLWSFSGNFSFLIRGHMHNSFALFLSALVGLLIVYFDFSLVAWWLCWDY